MSRKVRPLVQFDTSYYRSRTLYHGIWAIDLNWLHTEFHKMVNEAFADPSDTETFHLLVTAHGVFTEKFFHKAVRERVIGQFAKIQIDLGEFQELLSSASSSVRGYEHEWPLYNKWDAIYRIIDHIFRQTAHRAFNDSQTQNRVTSWVEEFKIPRLCALCGGEFRVIDLPEWVYFGSNGFQQCCFQCPVETPRKRELAKLIPSFVEACGFVPSSSAGPINHAFTSRLSTDRWSKTLLAYVKMGGIDHVNGKFGSWFEALAETGALPAGVLATARGVRCLAGDGHVCHSLDEQRIDNWLMAQGLPHEREPRYPTHPSLNPTGRRCADWRVQDTFIEYFGLIGDPCYEKKMGEKILLARHCGIDLITIHPSDLESLDQRLRCLLSYDKESAKAHH